MPELNQITKYLKSISVRPLLLAVLVLGATVVGAGIFNPGTSQALTINPTVKLSNWIVGMRWADCGPLNDQGMPPTLKKGDANRNCVLVLQHFLNNWNEPVRGRPLVEDGVFGTATENQVKDFQNYARWFGLSSGPTDGIVGNQTWSTIYDKCMGTNLEVTCHRVN